MLAILFGLVALPHLSLWTLPGVGAARVLRTRRALRLLDRTLAGSLAASLAPALRESREWPRFP